MKKSLLERRGEQGLTLLIALLVTAVMLSASVAIANIALQEVIFSISERDSNRAFFAADLGAECATYWDLTRNHFTPDNCNFGGCTPLQCGGQSISPVATSTGTFEYYFEIDGGDAGYCSRVLFDVDPVILTGMPMGIAKDTKIESRGYSGSCDDLTSKTVERALRIIY